MTATIKMQPKLVLKNLMLTGKMEWGLCFDEPEIVLGITKPKFKPSPDFKELRFEMLQHSHIR